MRYLVAFDLHYSLPRLDWIADQADEFDAAGHAALSAQISLMSTYLGLLADTTTGDCQLGQPRPHQPS